MYEHFPHEADIGIRGIGKTIEESFCEAAKALFNVEVKIKKVHAEKKVKIRADASNLSELLVEWLNALLAKASIHEMVFSKFKVKIEEKKGKQKLMGEAFGERLDVEKHSAKEEVKGATYSQLKVEKATKGKHKGKWIAQCIVDV